VYGKEKQTLSSGKQLKSIISLGYGLINREVQVEILFKVRKKIVN